MTVPTLLQAAADEDRPYRLAVIDARMPVLTGIELTQIIRNTPSVSSLSVLILTSSGSGRDAATRAGVDAFVTKPVHATRLLEEIGRALRPRRPSPSTPDAFPSTKPPANVVLADGPLVLVAEDNQINQRVAMALLEKRGFQVHIVADGRDAVDQCKRHRYRAVFMDCQMPTMDGYEATAEIRRREAGGPRTPIIAMTANSMSGDRERCLEAGMDDYIAKPIRSDLLDEVIAQAHLTHTAGLGRSEPG